MDGFAHDDGIEGETVDGQNCLAADDLAGPAPENQGTAHISETMGPRDVYDRRACQNAWVARLAGKAADVMPRSSGHLTGARRRRRELSVPGYANGADAPLRATAAALERARYARSTVLVEGISDQIAVETLANLQARGLAQEGVVVVPIGGARSVSRFLACFGPAGAGLRISGLCDAAEERHFSRELARAGCAQPATRGDLERQGFSVCDRDLEDELVRAVGPDAVETILAEQGDLASFRTLQKQAARRDACFVDQLRRFLGAGARRKLRYASLFVLALDLTASPDRSGVS